ncbi:MAG TPA: response regulator [Gemmatimonadales bacterium]|nr:response regulator [Gemmatimonadales bacterium]
MDAPPPARHVVSGETILVVDDEEVVRRLVARMLLDGGFRVVEAPDGVAALERLRRDSGDIAAVVTDVVMPRMDGRQLAAAIAECWSHIRVLYMTGYPRDRMTTAGRLYPGVPILYKPFTGEQLVRRLRDLLAPRGGPH